MSLLILWIGCTLSYKLGVFNQKHPGRSLELLRDGWSRMHV